VNATVGPAAGEAARLAALRSYRILDTDPEQRFDDLTMLASHVCATPTALITLVDADRQWFKSRVGTDLTETPRNISFCAHAMHHTDIFQVPDAREDERFKDNPLVTGETGIRFYAGAPLRSHDGYPLGTLCVFDRSPRTLSPDQYDALLALSRQVQAQLELRRSLIELKAALALRDAAEKHEHELLAQVTKLAQLLPLSASSQLDMVIPADPDQISTITEGVERLLHDKGWNEREVIGVELALREALANAIRHGCKGDPSKKVECCVMYKEPGEIVAVIRDPGQGFDTTEVPDPMAAENIFKSSGRGVFLINQVMDAVQFRDGGREIAMRKKRTPEPL
jgi:anti-sigma regulatory factor (Ser/Thr protein kinase)